MSLADKHCTPLAKGAQPLTRGEAEELFHETPGWTLELTSLERTYKFTDFRAAMAFANRVAEIADAENHHPDILVSYNTVKLTLSTHKVGGLTENDFILAAKINQV
jgi:4a-hydroxytetrahydrobiopterin dehydratase